uniref:FYR N-terminal domain-containing protein n=1 Tax=Panagrellus redivivus TaxID=6233 RepID=A0A7E4VR78_PANRE
MAGDAAFPAEVAGLFDVLVNRLIDGIEQISRDPEAANALAPAESHTSTTTFDHSTLRQPEPCTRPLRLKPSTIRRGYDFENNQFQCPSESGSSHKVRSIVDFDNYEPEESSIKLDKMLKSHGKTHTSGSHTTDGYENVRCCDAPHSPNREAAGFDDEGFEYTVSEVMSVQGETEVTGQTNLEVEHGCEYSVSESTFASSQRATLRTKRLAGDREGYEVTVDTVDDNGKPFQIRAVCPEFVPRRVWLNGEPLDYIDEESEEPIMSQPCYCEAECSGNADGDATTYEDSESTWT